jgi:type IV pilus assembly protein PilP
LKTQTRQFERIKGPLEDYPLEDLYLVGVIHQSGKTNALILIKQHKNLGLHSVRVGDYLGNKFGRILKISHENVWIKERHQDDSGVWIERDSTLHLVSHAV